MDEAKKKALEKILQDSEQRSMDALTGKFQDTGRVPSGAGEAIDSWSGAPARTAIGEMQNGNFGMDMLKKAWDQAGKDPKSAPTGEDLVRKTGVDNDVAAGVLGGGLQMAVDPTSYASFGGGAIPMSGRVSSVAKEAVQEAAPAFQGIKKMFQVGDKVFPAGSTAEALKIKAALEEAGQIAPNRALQSLNTR